MSEMEKNDIHDDSDTRGSRQGKRMLIIEVNWLGDVLFTTPFIHSVRHANADSYIACLIHPRCREMLEGNPDIDEIIEYDEERKHKSPIGKLKLILKLRDKKFDTAFILHRSFTKAAIAYLAGARKRIGYATKNRKALLTCLAEEGEYPTHKVEYFLNLARAYGIAPASRSYRFFVSDADREHAKKYFAENGIGPDTKIVALCPGGNWDPKRWSAENFARFADTISARTGAAIVITGGIKDKALGLKIKDMMKTPALVSCGDTNLKQLGAIFESSGLVVANDTGSMHIAVSVGAPVIALFGPTDPAITGPYGEGSYRVIARQESCDVPCYDLLCKDNRCMAAISVDDVLRAADEMFGKRS